MTAVRRLVIPFIVLTLLLAACGGEDAAPEPSTTAVADVSDAGGGDEVSSTSGDGGPDGQAAPDFALALGEGGSFVLSDEEKPVYMVFWAEW